MSDQTTFPTSTDAELTSGSRGDSWLPLALGGLLSGVFYVVVVLANWEPLQRYFLGHPVAVAATILFWLAVGVLMVKSWKTAGQKSQLDSLRDADISPSAASETPGQKWLSDHDAGFVAKNWLTDLQGLSQSVRQSIVVSRLEELLIRQSQRGSTKHLADDLRELSSRDADTSHDSFGLVRIIVWAIPMLGFLGTVIGITQTLGGLDFTDGTAAVDRLKSGLYVAFDTTALGLVLSVLAIFIQFPIERNEQRLLTRIDARVGNLLSNHLPNDDAVDDQTTLIKDLCEGIKAAVAESLTSQAQLWRATIDEAQREWQNLHQSHSNRIAEAFEETVAPVLSLHVSQVGEHTETLKEFTKQTSSRMDQDWEQWNEMLRQSNQALVGHYKTVLEQCEVVQQQTLQSVSQTEAIQKQTEVVQQYSQTIQQQTEAVQQHAQAIQQQTEISQQQAATLHQQTEAAQQQSGAMQNHAEVFQRQTESIHQQSQAVQKQTEQLQANSVAIGQLQALIDRGLRQAGEQTADALDKASASGLPKAMAVLAKAVDVLAKKMPVENKETRRAA